MELPSKNEIPTVSSPTNSISLGGGNMTPSGAFPATAGAGITNTQQSQQTYGGGRHRFNKNNKEEMLDHGEVLTDTNSLSIGHINTNTMNDNLIINTSNLSLTDRLSTMEERLNDLSLNLTSTQQQFGTKFDALEPKLVRIKVRREFEREADYVTYICKQLGLYVVFYKFELCLVFLLVFTFMFFCGKCSHISGTHKNVCVL